MFSKTPFWIQAIPVGIKAGSNVGSTSENAPDYEDASDYLDPSNDADYQLISQLREGLGNGFTNAKNSGDFFTIMLPFY